MHVQRDRVDGSVARVDDVHADFALEHAVARVRVQVQPVAAGHDRAGRKRGQEAHGRGGRRESTTRGHAAVGVGDGGGGGSVGGGAVGGGRLRPRVGQHGPNGNGPCGWSAAGLCIRRLLLRRDACAVGRLVGFDLNVSADDQSLDVDGGGDARKWDRRSGS